MSRAVLFLPFSALVVLAGYLGLKLGQPVTEMDVINFHAAQWVETGPDGAALTDCLATSVDAPDVWLAVTCTHESGAQRQVIVAPDGAVLDTHTETGT